MFESQAGDLVILSSFEPNPKVLDLVLKLYGNRLRQGEVGGLWINGTPTGVVYTFSTKPIIAKDKEPQGFVGLMVLRKEDYERYTGLVEYAKP